MGQDDSGAASGITVFGTQWCGDCHRSRAMLDRLDIAYRWHDVDEDEDARLAAIAVSGRRNVPVITMPDGAVLVEPSNPDLLRALVAAGVLPGTAGA